MTSTVAPPLGVLVISDKPVLASAIAVALNHGAYAARVAPDAPQALALAREWRPALALFDLQAGGSLEWLVKSLGVSGRTPVIALTRERALAKRLAAFDQGADDVLTVPFEPEELLARTIAVTRRVHRAGGTLEPVQRLGDLEVNILRRTVKAEEHLIHLTALELALLYLLAANVGRVVSHDEIVEYLWGADYLADSNVVERHIRNLRTKLRNNWRRPRYILTKRGLGYTFIRGQQPEAGAVAAGA